MPALTETLSDIVADGFAAADLPRELGSVATSNRPDLGQFQCNGAMTAARIAKRSPREIAQTIVDRLAGDDRLAAVSIAGPGFINLMLDDRYLADQTNQQRQDPRLGVAQVDPAATVILDFGGPNIAKPMHVGHLRATIIGDSLQRLFGFLGHRTVSDVHMGDWGLPMGMLISEIARVQPDLPYFDGSHSGPYPPVSPVTLEDLETLYPEAAKACKDDELRLEQARAATAALQRGRPGYRALWQHFINVSLAAMRREFESLGVHFDLYKGEADVDPLIETMVQDLASRHLARIDDGALVVPVARADDKAEIPPLILRKSDGSAMYATTDLATIVDRVAEHHPGLMLYVVDQRQHLHFEQVFRVAEAGGLSGGAAMEHIGFGTMNGADGRPFKTRAGGVMKLSDLIEMCQSKAAERLAEAGLAGDYPPEERDTIARQVGLAALKFADLSNHRLSNYVFDLDRFTQFEGKTGPYLQYAAVRIRSLLRKAAERDLAPGDLLPPGDAERPLLLKLGQLPEAVVSAAEKRAPNEICDYAYGLAQEFSRFYNACHILSETDTALQASRLGLAEMTLRALDRLLDLLGISVPDRM